MIMRNDMYENNWSPFDPQWYQAAFDQFISTADQLFNTDLIIQQGFHIPDVDGSRSSIFRNESVLNNSFNEQKLRETLKDIYLNSSHRLVASNHDNVHFYKWHGYISNMELIPNTNMCQFKIPTDTFISSKERNKLKLSQFYCKWLNPEDILNNWEIFKWCCMLFIDHKIYSEYELRIDDHETIIRFKYYDYWVKVNHPVYIYKFDTNASCRTLISKELCCNQCNWKIPVAYIDDQRVINSTNIIVAFNKISDPDIRTDGLTHVDVMGDNLEFLKIENGYIDLSNISKFNKSYIQSESSEWLWMSIIVPKFLHEYPIMLPTDIVYRPYKADLRPVYISDNMGTRNANTNINGNKKVFVDINDNFGEEYSNWMQMIRPLVLSDAFDDPFNEPYMSFIDELKNLRDLTIKGADTIEEFKFFMKDSPTDEKFIEFINKLSNEIDDIHDAYNIFLKKRLIETDKSYEYKYKDFCLAIEDIKKDGLYSEWFNDDIQDKVNIKDFWTFISPQIYIPRELYDKYSIVYTIESIDNHGILWDNIKDLMGTHRFRRPIDEQDFWTFEYDIDNQVWRPYHLDVIRHFQDVYLLNDPSQEVPSLNRIFKAFFFYSDTMNVNNQYDDIIRATPSWDNDMQEYEYDKGAIYRDIFMEKFYWMGVRSIYKELLTTKSRWEVIEYVIDNSSYERFNKLFLKTMDPYFKMGLATYLRSSNYEFPFDYAIDKMNESINTEWLGYKKVTNFEMYLNNTWIPSYFDYIVKIMDEWEPGERLVRRPRSSFDILKLLPLLLSIENNIVIAVGTVSDTLDWVISKLEEESYHLNVDNIKDIKNKTKEMLKNIEDVYQFTNELDLDIYDIEDLNVIINKLKYHIQLTNNLEELFNNSFEDVNKNNVYLYKKTIIQNIYNTHLDNIYDYIISIGDMIQDFNMEKFMLAINNIYIYFDHNKDNSDDTSLLGYINKFNTPWSDNVKTLRNTLFQSSSKLYGNFKPNKSYSNEEVIDFYNNIMIVKNDISNFYNEISMYWSNFEYEKDQIVIDKFDNVNSLLDKLIVSMDNYMDYRNRFLEEVNKVSEYLESMIKYNISNSENVYYKENNNFISNIIGHLSYIAGSNNRDSAINDFQKLKNNIIKWNSFIVIEEEVFSKLLYFTESPIEFIDRLRRDEKILYSIIEYMDSTNIPYIPDNTWPTYSDVYSINEIEIVNGGFNNNIDDFIAIPGIGSYKISDINKDNKSVINLNDTGYRNTTFKDPLIQLNPYDAISNGDGMGIIVKPISSTHIPIINDEIIRMYIMKIQNSSYTISSNLDNPNPYNNNLFNECIQDISNIEYDWNNIMEFYNSHMSNEAINYINELISLLKSLIEPCETLINTREKVDIASLIPDIDSIINDCHNFAEENNLMESDYQYYENNLKLELNKLINFYGNGTSWNDYSYIKNILNDIKYPIRLFRIRVINKFPDSQDKLSLLSRINDILTKISGIEDVLTQLPNIIIDINPIIRSIETIIKETSSDIIRKDSWYRIRNVRVALEGEGYKVGDVLSIVPELPKDHEGNYIHDMEDIIMNDVILIKIKEVIDGKVTLIEPLLDYAIPYLIWGIRETKTLIGNGKGLTVDVYSYQLELSDSKLFEDSNSDISTFPQYNENDMFVFKFENIHDLNIEYEVFYGGKQITNFFHRHISSDNRLHPNNIDALYINANEISDLKNSSIYIPAENYFIYKLDKVEIKDPGAGYAVGQEIFVDLESIALRLKVANITSDPYKGITEVEMANVRISDKVDNPSCTEARVIDDSLNNIDDEFNVGYYDKLTKDGIIKGATISLDPELYTFTSRRFDNLEDGDRNKNYMYPDVNIPLVEGVAQNGDPDENFYLGSRIDNSYHQVSDNHVWNGIMNVIPPTDPFIPDDMRIPTGKPIKGEYQLISQQRFHNSVDETNDNVTVKFNFSIKNSAMINGDYVVNKFSQLPKTMDDWPDAKIGKCVIVENDETNNGHRMLYRLRTFVAAGFFVFDLPENADYKWNHIDVDWMNCDFYPDYPSIKSKYPDAPWNSAKTYLAIQRSITDGEYIDSVPAKHNGTTYIHNITLDDISVWNCNKHEWENLYDENKWKLEVINDPDKNKWGFRLTYLEEGTYSYDMKLFLNKIPENQMRNASLKRNAILDIAASISQEINNPAINSSINTGRHLRIRKLFPYEQKETYKIGKNPDGSYIGYEMNFIVAPYMHFRNELHLEDVKIYNKSAGRFENILDPKLFEVRFKDDKAKSTGYETQTKIIQTIISHPGQGFVDGEVWAYNQEFDISVFGVVTTNYRSTGNILTFTPIHSINAPTDSISLEFQVYQRDDQTNKHRAIVIIEFNTEKVQVRGDGYIHNVTNPYAPLPKEFKVICQYNLDSIAEYDIIISKSTKKWKFIEPKWMVSPTFHLPDYNIQKDRIYILTSAGRFPLVNPSTGKPSIDVVQTDNGTDVTFLNLYKRFEHLEVRTVPYPMRSVYVQRRIPKSGYIDLSGKINKPLNKKYFEFWVNGRLLYDEVTIITPTKIFLHGLKSLKNLEIIEVNRDPNEYFSDAFLEVDNSNNRPYYSWNYKTYLDDALEGNLGDDNYTPEEQEYLLSPVWKQVEKDHPEFKNFPPNVDTESDILTRVDEDDYPLEDLTEPTYQFMILNVPTLEGEPIIDRNMSFDDFGFIPMTDSMIIDIMNEEWKDEIDSNPYFPEHSIMTDAEWYGMTARLYDEYGIRVHTLDESAYHITDHNLLRINTDNKLTRIIKNKISYDLN